MLKIYSAIVAKETIRKCPKLRISVYTGPCIRLPTEDDHVVKQRQHLQ